MFSFSGCKEESVPFDWLETPVAFNRSMMTLCLNKSPLHEVFRQTKAKKGAELNPKKSTSQPKFSKVLAGVAVLHQRLGVFLGFGLFVGRLGRVLLMSLRRMAQWHSRWHEVNRENGQIWTVYEFKLYCFNDYPWIYRGMRDGHEYKNIIRYLWIWMCLPARLVRPFPT